MYEIIIDNTIKCVDNIKFIKNQKNGVIILCKEHEAQGMVSFDENEYWAFKGKGLEDEVEKVVEIRKLTNEEHLNLMNQELTQQITNMELAMAEIYEMMLGGTN